MSIKDRGFASMSRKRHLEIASKGGKRGHELGVAHQWTREEARKAGKKGGRISAQRRWGKKEQAA
jgi:general stress protein YciG